MSRSVAIFDLDHGILSQAPGRVLGAELGSAGARSVLVQAAEQLHRLADAAGPPLGGEATVRGLCRVLAGTPARDLREAAERAAGRVRQSLAPHAPPIIREHREADRRLVATTHVPRIAAEPIAEALGFDVVVATELQTTDGEVSGSIRGPVVWGRGKLQALRRWSADNGASLRRSYAYSGSVHDAPLLAEVGNPVVVDPDPRLAALAWLKGWKTRSLHAPPGVLRVGGQELQDLLRPFARPELVPYARFEFHGLDHIPSAGPAIVCANHRSYFDVTTVGLALAQRGRAVRGLGKREVFDAPLVGAAARWLGGIRVERGTGSDEPLLEAAKALEAGELIMIMPQGTIPRGPAFFDPELKGRWGAARLAAITKAPVIPLGLWGTEKVWPRSSRLPKLNPLSRPLVTVRAGPPVTLSYDSPDADTKAIMSAIVDLLPQEAKVRHEPTTEELALTYPPGYRGDPSKETERRPGTDL